MSTTENTGHRNGRPSVRRGRPPLSPESIAHHGFGDARLGRRGYDRGEVDAFLARLAGEVRSWIEENSVLRGDNDRLRNYFRDHGVEVDAGQTRRVSAEAVSLMSRAQAQAERTLSEARDQAALEVHDAKAQAAEIIARARAEADRAARAYRVAAGGTYSATTEERRRLVAWLNTILQTLAVTEAQLPAVRAQLHAAAQALAWEIHRIADDAGVSADTPVSPAGVPRRAGAYPNG